VTAADVPVLSRVLARAFYDDPAASWIFHDDDRRLDLLTSAWALQMERNLAAPRRVLHDDGPRRRVVLAAGRARRAKPIGEQLALGPTLVRAMGPLQRALARVARPRRAPPSAFTRPLVPATAGRRPRPPGPRLRRATCCRRSSSAATPTGSARTSRRPKESNIPFYERHGFKVTKQVKLPFTGPPIWLMWRDPA